MQALDRMLPQGAVHQGLALSRSTPLEGVALERLAGDGGVHPHAGPGDRPAERRRHPPLGGGLRGEGHRSCRTATRPRSPGALAKAAAGAIERLPCARVVNLVRALETLADLGWRAVGLDGAAELTLDAGAGRRPTVLVLGSEGDGLRRLVAEHCDVLAKIPMPGGFESLNVSTAAAVALYEATRKRG